MYVYLDLYVTILNLNQFPNPRSVRRDGLVASNISFRPKGFKLEYDQQLFSDIFSLH